MKAIVKKLLTKLFWGFFRHLLSDKKYAQIRYWLELDKWPNIKVPKKFTEKIQHIKLNERTQIRKTAANRTAVRSYVAQKIGDNYLVPLIGTYEALTQQTWSSFPSQFVLKANHGCGMLEIVSDKQQRRFREVQQKTEIWKQTSYYHFGREWAYKDLPRTIVAEELLLTAKGSIPKDYKFFCFNGKVKLIQIDYNRFSNQKRNLFDTDFNRINGTLLYPPHHGSIEKPNHLQEAIELAEKLSSTFTFIRVDLYLFDNEIYFGELTNYPGNGFVPFKPDSLEYKMGSYLSL